MLAGYSDCRSSFDEYFRTATQGCDPFPFQKKYAEADPPYEIVRVPTGLGKTAMAVVGWLWRRFGGSEALRASAPRRLVYCLPMRVLVEQTAENARRFVANLREAGVLDREVEIHLLLGGENEVDWDIQPEREAILVGTQDMLLSRALNRGYAASRARWPMQFGLLNNDCQWVFDEIQLMGAGLATTTQLEAFRRLLPAEDSQSASAGHGCRSVWMSATMQEDWLGTVDFRAFLAQASALKFEFAGELRSVGLEEGARKQLASRWDAKKKLEKSGATMEETVELAREVLGAHREACAGAGKGTRTLVVVNTVKRALGLFDELEKPATPPVRAKKGRKKPDAAARSDSDEEATRPRVVLLHSRFRPDDRKSRIEEALEPLSNAGTVVVSTQVIEAGVDVSATTLFTELAPWASLVQRFGRCNRTGEDFGATVHWIDLPGEKRSGDFASPYEMSALGEARVQLEVLQDVGLQSLPPADLRFDHVHVVRRRDLIDLFDTTPDLAGSDIDIDRFVREVDESDVRVFWRRWDRPRGREAPPDDLRAPAHEELCPAPIGTDKNPGFRQFAKEHRGQVWRWSFLDKRWEKCDQSFITPGQVYLVHSDAGGYLSSRGWTPDSKEEVSHIGEAVAGQAEDATDDDRYSRSGTWQTVDVHNGVVRRELADVMQEMALNPEESAALDHAALWHDRGKAHRVFQEALPDLPPESGRVWAKGKGIWKRYSRRHFRHELASALAVLDPRNSLIPEDCRDLIAYLVAAHHGKVRLSIRSLPGEHRPGGGGRFARGIWDGDELPETPLEGITAPGARLSLEPMEMGLCEEEPFAGLPSWAERMLGLRIRFGPFRLAFLEAVLRAADIRASRSAESAGEARS